MRITKKERKKNANQFYNMFMNGSCDEAASDYNFPKMVINPAFLKTVYNL